MSRARDYGRVCLIRLPKINLGPGKRDWLVYASGALFAVGWWFFLDVVTLSANARPPPDAPYDVVPVHIRFPDWIPGLCSTIGMIIVNLIDKSRLMGDDDGGSLSFGGMGGVAWKARLFLFLGFAMMAGGLAGSVTVLVLKYIIPDYQDPIYTYWGLANVLQSVCIMLSATTLWVAQSASEEFGASSSSSAGIGADGLHRVQVRLQLAQYIKKTNGRTA